MPILLKVFLIHFPAKKKSKNQFDEDFISRLQCTERMIFGETTLAKRALHDLPYGHLRNYCMHARASLMKSLSFVCISNSLIPKEWDYSRETDGGEKENVGDNAISPNISP